jgi:hypothetical protein
MEDQLTQPKTELIQTNKPIEVVIAELFDKYKENQYMLNRLQIYVTNLPNLLEVENKRYEERLLRINELTMEQDNFYKVFLMKHQYFYMPYNNIYYEYDGKTYKIIKDDDIHHHLLSTITDEGKLMAWKHKTKQNIIRQIKDRTLFKSVPETYTIQNVLGFLQTIFDTKSEAKYFLTIIGDCILKKNSGEMPLQYFINANTKKLVLLIDSIAYITTGNSIMSNFISKYHDTHNLSSYRLIKTTANDSGLSTELIKDMLNKIGIDLLCVAAHYSDRYTNSDNFLITESDETNKQYSLFFVNNLIDKIGTDFIKQCLDLSTNVTMTANALSWKNMHYIWKQYLSSINIPNMLYTNGLKELLKGKLLHSSGEGDVIFLNVTSKYLPSVSSFLSFWDKHIAILDNNVSFDDEYEIEEILTLYKSSEFKNVPVSDKEIIKMINHYYSPQVEVIENKYITNIRCNLWIKHEDIHTHLETFKSAQKMVSNTSVINHSINHSINNSINNSINHSNKELISFDELYKSYKSYCIAKHIVDKQVSPIVSKQFFEKFLLHELQQYIQFDKFVSSQWLNDE